MTFHSKTITDDAAPPELGALAVIEDLDPADAASIEEDLPRATAGPARDPIAGMIELRDRLGAELVRLDVFAQRRADAEARLREVEQALKIISASDVEAIERWAKAPEGEPPQPLIEERRALLARRLDIELELGAAEAGARAVEARRAVLVGELKRIGLTLLQTCMNSALTEAHRLHAEAEGICKMMAAPLFQIAGLHQALITLSIAASNRGDETAQGIIAQALVAVGALEPPMVMRDPAAINAAAADWSNRLR